MAKYSVFDVASWIKRRSTMAERFEGGEKLSLMKLMKLLYYSEGCSLASDNGSLFDDPILAWEHGPVVRSVWNRYHDYLYDLPCTEEDYIFADRIIGKDDEVLEGTYETFGIYSAWGLRNKTHKETPWLSTPINEEISRDKIEKYFRKHYVICE